MDICSPRDIHDTRTRRGDLSYCFTPKHHGAGSSSDSRWLPDLSRPEEFRVFDMADDHEVRDEENDLYGLRIAESDGERKLEELGTKHELVARFWAEVRPEDLWHGHPLWPLRSPHAENRAKQVYCPPQEVFDRMVEAHILSPNQARRLKIGKHVGKLD